MLLDIFWDYESDLNSYGWFERVPSPSNLSDAPSRLRDILGNALEIAPPDLPERLSAAARGLKGVEGKYQKVAAGRPVLRVDALGAPDPVGR